MREVKDLHEPFRAYLRKHNIPFVYHRPDKRSGITKGWPDFTVVWAGRTELIEFKTPEGQISADQTECHLALIAAGCTPRLCTGLEEAIGYIEALTGEKRCTVQGLPLSVPSPKLWLVRSNMGSMVVEKREKGVKFVRVASQDDVLNIPYLPVA